MLSLVPRSSRAALALVGAAVALPAAAQDAVANAPTSLLQPSLTAEESYLETRGRITGDNGHEAVSRLTPGFRYISRSGRVQGSIDYAADLLYRLGRGATEGGDVQNNLNATLTAEAVPAWMFVDARATISQQSISPFGQQTAAGSAQANNNRTEVSTLTLTPYVRGSIGGYAGYEVRLLGAATSSRDATAPDSHNSAATVALTSSPGGTVFGWALTAARQRVEFKGQDPVDTSNVNAQLSVSPAPEVRLSVNGGRESSDDATLDTPNHTNTSGVGLQWNPSPRTSFGADVTERYFGRSKHVNFSHRAQHTAWLYVLTRDTTNGAAGVALLGQATRLQLRMEQIKDLYPDPVQREQAALTDLVAAGFNPNQIVDLGILASSFSIQRRQDFTFTWFGQRMSYTLSAYTTALSQLTLVEGADPLIGEPVSEHGYSSTLTYRLTPQSSVAIGGSRTMVFSTSTRAGTDLKSAYMTLSSQLGQRTTAQLGARYTVFNSTTDPYRETSLSASISLRY